MYLTNIKSNLIIVFSTLLIAVALSVSPFVVSAQGLTQQQIESILTLLESFEADESVVNNVRAALTGRTQIAAPVATFNRNLAVGTSGEDVRRLQVWLNSNGYIIATSGPGSPGNESNYFGELTRQAVARYQSTNGISPAVGYFGEKTRSTVNDTLAGFLTVDFKDYVFDILFEDIVDDPDFEDMIKEMVPRDTEFSTKEVARNFSECVVLSIDGSLSDRSKVSIMTELEEKMILGWSKAEDFFDLVSVYGELGDEKEEEIISSCLIVSLEEVVGPSFDVGDIDFKIYISGLIYEYFYEEGYFREHMAKILSSDSPKLIDDVILSFSKCFAGVFDRGIGEQYKSYILKYLEIGEFETSFDKMEKFIEITENVPGVIDHNVIWIGTLECEKIVMEEFEEYFKDYLSELTHDSSIKSELGQMRAIAELEGHHLICQNEIWFSVIRMANSAECQGAETSNDRGWLAVAELSDGSFWCSDYTGFSGEVDTGTIGSAEGCMDLKKFGFRTFLDQTSGEGLVAGVQTSTLDSILGKLLKFGALE